MQFVYDRIGRLIRRIHTVSGDVKRTWFTYDGLNRIASVKYYDDALVNYEYTGPWLTRVYEGAVTYAQYTGYNAQGQPGTLSLGNGVGTTYTYAIEGGGSGTCQAASFRLCTLVTTKSGATLQNLTYGYDVNGNVTAITDPIGGNQSYTYDNNDRVWHASGPVFNMDYGSDPLDNLTYWPVVGHYAYPPSQLGYGHHPHAVCATGASPPGSCSGGTTQYTYDPSGNMLSGAGRTLVYDAVNRLTSVTTAGGATSFVYDGDGARVQKTVPIGGGSTKTVKYFDKWVECETSGGTTACTKYIWAGDLRVAMKQVTGGATTYYHADKLGSTVVVTDGAGTQQESIQYYPFGEQWTDTGSANVPYKYTGQEYDASTGLYYYKARYYDAHLGRFIQPDTIISSAYVPAAWNRYSYVMNNPMKYTDPTGHDISDTGFFPGLVDPSVLMQTQSQTANLQPLSSSDPLGINSVVAGFAYGVSLYNSLGSSVSGTTYTVSNGAGQSGDILSRVTEGERATVAAAGSEIYYNVMQTGNEYGAAVGRAPSSGEYGYQMYTSYSPYVVAIGPPPQGTVLQARIHGHPTTPGFSPDDLLELSRSEEVRSGAVREYLVNPPVKPLTILLFDPAKPSSPVPFLQRSACYGLANCRN